jgi:hypothetical protein
VVLSYIGSGKYRLKQWPCQADAARTAQLSGKTHTGVRAVSQEIDGDQATSELWTVKIDINPVKDGFASWNPVLLQQNKKRSHGSWALRSAAWQSSHLATMTDRKEVSTTLLIYRI